MTAVTAALSSMLGCSIAVAGALASPSAPLAAVVVVVVDGVAVGTCCDDDAVASFERGAPRTARTRPSMSEIQS